MVGSLGQLNWLLCLAAAIISDWLGTTRFLIKSGACWGDSVPLRLRDCGFKASVPARVCSKELKHSSWQHPGKHLRDSETPTLQGKSLGPHDLIAAAMSQHCCALLANSSSAGPACSPGSTHAYTPENSGRRGDPVSIWCLRDLPTKWC